MVLNVVWKGIGSNGCKLSASVSSRSCQRGDPSAICSCDNADWTICTNIGESNFVAKFWCCASEPRGQNCWSLSFRPPSHVCRLYDYPHRVSVGSSLFVERPCLFYGTCTADCQIVERGKLIKLRSQLQGVLGPSAFSALSRCILSEGPRRVPKFQKLGPLKTAERPSRY